MLNVEKGAETGVKKGPADNFCPMTFKKIKLLCKLLYVQRNCNIVNIQTIVVKSNFPN